MPQQRINAIRDALAEHIHGKPAAIDATLTCLIAGGHLLIEDVPGVGKTTLAYALSRAIHCDFNRVQFTSDIIPSDIVGVSVYQKDRSQFEFLPGPVFANIVLADEINRASPKAQSALLEAMERGLVTSDGVSHPIDRPFMVIATQNPVDFESTFPLPSAQLDRFLMRISLGYPDDQSERDMLRHGALHYDDMEIQSVAEKGDIADLQSQAREVFMEESIYDYIHSIVTRTRQHPQIEVGISPRGALAFKAALQAAALVDGRSFVEPNDIRRFAVPCLAHRLRLRERYDFEYGWQNAAHLIEEILNAQPAPHLKD
ncbi:AAA family ATPase [Pelagicoccus sp. SDUM812003]|uniref:AAA family ATPase n=1 Tax=Pelagicoccus sp. SDUM812003 TaxID=3041267 RepID=UPI00280F1C77|nr:AAA family ATPase [Pelagicoccus sp. SDUM812003]MDQ8202488.1 AAA family ATPase [Pelagicoccus sp. SDUM812003]